MIVPSGNDTANATSAWVPEPNGRGTWSLLSTCIITISLCVWSAVHLNVPEYQKTHVQYWRKGKWLLLGLFAPELVAFVAWQQRKEALRLCQDVRAIYGQKAPSSFCRRVWHYLQNLLGKGAQPITTPASPTSKMPFRSEWELVHGFYVLMGGFTLASGETAGEYSPSRRNEATLTPDGLRFLLQYESEALPDINADQIKDRSKADGLKKMLVCAQALWFCIQCIARISQSLPVSLLELNTVGHALCTLVIYVFWWEKPLDIEEPTVVQDAGLHPIVAYMWMSSRVSAQGHCNYDMPHGLQDEFHCLWPFSRPTLDVLTLTRREASRSPPNPNPELLSIPGTSRPHYISAAFQLKQNLQSLLLPNSASHRAPAGLGVRKTAISHLSPTDLARWDLAFTAIRRYDLEDDLRSRHRTATSGRLYSAALNIRVPFFHTLLNNNLNPRVEMRARNAVLSVAPSGIFSGFALSGALYGGLHLAAWATTFSSPLEKLLWQIAGMSVTLTGVLFGALAMLVKTKFARRSLSNAIKMVTRKSLEGSSKDGMVKAYVAAILMGFVSCFVVPCLPFLWLLYLSSRGYLVVESLKNVAFLPPAAFETPAWPAYFPHIT